MRSAGAPVAAASSSRLGGDQKRSRARSPPLMRSLFGAARPAPVVAASSGRARGPIGENERAAAPNPPGGNRRVAGEKLRQWHCLVGPGDEPQKPVGTREGWVGQRHPPAAPIVAGHGDGPVDDVEDRVARKKRGGVAVVSQTEVDEI